MVQVLSSEGYSPLLTTFTTSDPTAADQNLEVDKDDVNSSRRKKNFLVTEYGEQEYIGSSRLWVGVSLFIFRTDEKTGVC